MADQQSILLDVEELDTVRRRRLSGSYRREQQCEDE